MEREKVKQINLSNKHNLINLILLFGISYFIIYLIYISLPSLFGINLRSWAFTHIFKADYMNIVLPIVGFFSIFLVIEWANNYFGEDIGSKWYFPAVFLLLSIFSYYVVLVWYFTNIYQLGDPNALKFNFLDKFISSPFLMFVFGGFFGWLSNYIMHRLQK